MIMKERPKSGILIAIEGIDGAGKTTQLRLLSDFLKRLGNDPVCSKEPTDGQWGRKIRESAFSGRMSAAEELHAFKEDRKEHVRDLILPALAANRTVILDRYFYSTLAYQGIRGGDVDSLMAEMLNIAPEPDIVFLLDVSPEVSLLRIQQGRGEIPNEFEKIENLQLVRFAFLRLAEKYSNIKVIDARQSAANVHFQIISCFANGILKPEFRAKLPD
jgi:dTMP kinase